VKPGEEKRRKKIPRRGEEGRIRDTPSVIDTLVICAV
jgi:hypothetical protein